MMTKQECETLISTMDEIEEIRYIVLTNKITLAINIKSHNPYSYVVHNCFKNKCLDIKSCVILSSNSNEVSSLARCILRTLLMNPIDSFLGISIVADAPQYRNVNLNVKRPGVLRQYYGMDIEQINEFYVRRVAYRSQTSFQSEDSDPHKLVIKPFLDDMKIMAEYFKNFINININDLQLENVDTTNNFNTCTILLYHSLPDIKKESSMGWHCDSRYSVLGKFSDKLNGQMYNTPVIIFSIGKSRLLKWRKRFTVRNSSGHCSFEIEEGSEFEMFLNEGYFLILNPKDEEPHQDIKSGKTIHYQHGDTKVIGDDISIAFIFRVSQHSCICSCHDNLVKLPGDIIKKIEDKELKGEVNQNIREKKYSEFNYVNYHNEIKLHFEKYFNQ